MWDAAYITGWSTTIFSLITIPFYILFLCMLIKYRKTTEFNHAFFKIMMSLSVADILQLMVSEFVNQFLTFHGWVADFCLNVLGDFSAHILTMLLWGTGMAQHLAVVSVAVNRFTAYVYPIRFNLIWSSKCIIYLAVWLPWLLSCVFLIPMATMEHYFYNFTGSNLTHVDSYIVYCSWKSTDDLQKYYSSSIITIVTATVVLSILYGSVFVKAYQEIKKAKLAAYAAGNNRKNDKAAKMALKMTICGAVVAAGLIMLGVLFASNKIYYRLTSLSIPRFQVIHQTLINLYGGINPYIFMICSRTMRDRMFEMLGVKWLIKKKAKVTPIQS